MPTTRALRLALFLSLLCSCGSRAFAQATQSPLPKPTGYVNDYADVIDPATKQRLETILTNLKQVADIEFAVVTVRTTGDQDIFDYSLAVARGWGIGSKEGEQKGLLLLVAIDDRKYFTQVSRHLEGDLPDGLVGQIQRSRLVPPFKQGDYSKGISDTVETYVATLAEKQGFSVDGIDQRRAYRPTSSPPVSTTAGGFSPSCCVALIILFVILMILSNRGRRGGGGSGCMNLLLLNTLFNAAGGGRR
ncbi:MAG: TPM domain-containing protein, partial [Acidobacteria bacterium]|nr:TPM domain-containing protein [Acidobacteriota bacterium]